MRGGARGRRVRHRPAVATTAAAAAAAAAAEAARSDLARGAEQRGAVRPQRRAGRAGCAGGDDARIPIDGDQGLQQRQKRALRVVARGARRGGVS